ncbi:Mitochondrial distribution and morphology protein 12 [Steccherinum ochraceum]|uniref:Mitochondrial distribution and morphology protein 12 n=1 Tax=Steccherinum ochraceum TaxID=92696 RepID=A0A4R0RWN1_9APHY|nr:Mitochondrial distribution and morphology protein 12 [Steccherinum ochraceum]
MSVDLEWDKLDSSLASSLVDALNRQLANTQRPSFIGPVEVTSFDFGTVSPDVELVDLRDIYRDFLEDDEELDDVDREPIKVTEGGEDDDGFEWVSRKAARAQTIPEDVPEYHLLPPHMRYGRSRSQDMYASTPSLHSPRDMWNPAMMSLADLRPTYPYASGYASPIYRPPSSMVRPFTGTLGLERQSSLPIPLATKETSLPPTPSPDPSPSPQPANTHPNLQVHMHITWHSNLRLTFTTSLLINYPSPMFMSLPIKLSVTGLLFDGEVAVAYEGERRRVHLCVLDDLDPYCPLAGDRPKRGSGTGTGTPNSSGGGSPENEDETTGNIGMSMSMPGPNRAAKPLPVGQRLLPSILIESEIGQTDKHVLKNVTRVERFIQDVIRKTVEEELVFPNFHTLVLPDPE